MALLLAVLLSLAAANTQLQNAETEVNIKPNGQQGEASVAFVCSRRNVRPILCSRIIF